MADFYPKTLADRIPWHDNFATQVTATGTAHGLSAGQVTQIGVDRDTVTDIVNYLSAVDAFAQSVTEFKNLVLDGELNTPFPTVPAPPASLSFEGGQLAAIQARTRQYANIIKADSDYTPAVGEDYGIVGPVSAGPGTPSLTATALTQSQVRLLVAKAGYAIVAIDSRRGGGAWEQIGIAQVAEFIDQRAPLVAGQPEQREYRAQGMQSNQRVGALSPVVTAVTVP